MPIAYNEMKNLGRHLKTMVEICGEILVSLSSHLYYILVCQIFFFCISKTLNYMVYEWYSYPSNSKRHVKDLLHQLENTKVEFLSAFSINHNHEMN